MQIFARLSSQPWHLKCLTALLAVWCLWSLFGITYALSTAPAGMGLSIGDYYAFFAIPLLIGVGVFLLLAKIRWVTLVFALLPFAYWIAAVRLYPAQLSPVGRTIDLAYFSMFPMPFKFGMLFFPLCALYALVLAKRGHLH